MTADGPSQLPKLAAWAEARLPRLIEQACTATVERIPFYRDARWSAPMSCGGPSRKTCGS
jgi:hypothetical protein